MSNAIEQSYDRLPYLSDPFPETHPRHLQAVAHLFNLDAPHPDTARILELGCAVGGNLIPMAYTAPRAQFLGIDLSSVQIAAAQQAVQALRLGNIEFRHLSITDVTPALGQFDYILCHGVFSWVPPDVQQAIFRICRENLSPRGVAYISFNTYPGWNRRQLAREIMLFQASQFQGEADQVREARNLLHLLAESPLFTLQLNRATFKSEYDQIASKPDAYIAHEYLEEYNEPLYFHQFMAGASAASLQYLGDARLNGTIAEEAWAPAAQLLASAGSDIVRREQYADFLRNRMFRRALLCHAGLPLDRAAIAARLRTMSVATPMRRQGAMGATVTFASRGSTLNTAEPLLVAALDLLGPIFPQSLPFSTLLQRLRATPQQADALAQRLAECWMAGGLDAYRVPHTFATQPGPTPIVSAVARYQALQGDRLSNLCHTTIGIDALMRNLIRLCDGSRTQADLVRELSSATLPSPPATWLPMALQRLAANALLVQ